MSEVELAETEVVEEETTEVEKHDGFVSVADNQAQVNKQHRKFRDAERAAARVKADNERINKELEDLKAKSVDLTVPDVPDPYSDTYQADIAARDAAIANKAEHDAQARSIEADKQKTEQAERDRAEQVDRERVAEFDTRMVKHGLDATEVNKAATTLVEYGISDTFQDVLLDDTDGPLMVAYLADNPVEVEKINSMSTLELVNYLNAEIRPKASLLKPKTSDAPDPPRILSGGGAREIEDPLLKGAVFE